MSTHDRSRIEDFLYLEADLLDQWRLPEWLALSTDAALYEAKAQGRNQVRVG